MSEDVDYKLVPTPETMVLSNGKRRAALGDFAKAAIDALQAGRFGQGSVERRSRNANAYTRLDVSYESAFPKPAALRGHLLVEFNHSPLRLEPDKRLVAPAARQVGSRRLRRPVRGRVHRPARSLDGKNRGLSAPTLDAAG